MRPVSPARRSTHGTALLAALLVPLGCAAPGVAGGSDGPDPGGAIGTGSGTGPAAPAPAPSGLDARVTRVMEQGEVAGVVVLVVHADTVAFERSYGLVAHGADEPMTPDVVLRAGWVTPLLNGVAAAHLAARGKVALDAPVGDYVPDLLDPVGDVTLSQLLTHTSGLALEFVRGPARQDELGFAARWLTPLDVVAPPGELVTESNTGPLLAARALEQAGEADYREVIERTVFEPLGMTRSTLDPAQARAWGMPEGARHAGDDPRAELERLDAAPDSVLRRPTHGLRASPRDLARLAAAIVSDGVVDGERRLPEGVAGAVAVPRVERPFGGDDPVWFGYGSRFVEWEGRQELRAWGGTRGHTVVFRLLPGHQLGVIVAASTAGAAVSPLFDVAEVALRAILQLPHQRPSARARSAARDDPPPTPLDVADLGALAGTYRNGTETLELEVRNGRLTLVSGDIRLPTTVESDGALRARIADGRVAMELRLLRDRQGTLYLYYRDRAFRRVE